MKDKLLSIGVMTISCGFIAALGAHQSPKHPDGALGALRQLGFNAAKAVVDRDVSTLLNYDRSDLRADDEVSLGDKRSDLYCFLFDSTCLPVEKAGPCTRNSPQRMN